MCVRCFEYVYVCVCVSVNVCLCVRVCVCVCVSFVREVAETTRISISALETDVKIRGASLSDNKDAGSAPSR